MELSGYCRVKADMSHHRVLCTHTMSALYGSCRSWYSALLIFVERKIEITKAGAAHRNISK